MTFTELMSLLNGNYIEVAGTSAKNQCVDLANAYIKYVLGLPPIEYTNAKDFPSKAGSSFDYILNTPTGVPSEGDLVIWSGVYGHIAIFIEGNTSRFTSFDQNSPTGSPCHVQEHTYTNVLGWLHCKVPNPQNTTIIIEELRADRDKNWNLYQGSLNKQIELETVVQQKQKTIDNLTKENLELKEQIADVQAAHLTDLEAIQSQKTTNETLSSDVITLQTENAKLATNLEDCQLSKTNLSYATGTQLLNELLKRIIGK